MVRCRCWAKRELVNFGGAREVGKPGWWACGTQATGQMDDELWACKFVNQTTGPRASGELGGFANLDNVRMLNKRDVCKAGHRLVCFAWQSKKMNRQNGIDTENTTIPSLCHHCHHPNCTPPPTPKCCQPPYDTTHGHLNTAPRSTNTTKHKLWTAKDENTVSRIHKLVVAERRVVGYNNRRRRCQYHQNKFRAKGFQWVPDHTSFDLHAVIFLGQQKNNRPRRLRNTSSPLECGNMLVTLVACHEFPGSHVFFGPAIKTLPNLPGVAICAPARIKTLPSLPGAKP